MRERTSVSFSSAIISENKSGFIAVIPDIKCISPKEGDLLKGRDPVDMAKYLVQCGAPLLSVVTEQKRFGGSADLLRAIVNAVEVPVLRKDFIIDKSTLEETAELGATAVLLICAITDEKNLKMLYKKALQLNLEPLVEVHTVLEAEFASNMGARLIGINNRDIRSFEQDDGGPSTTAALAGAIPSDTVLVSESGILSVDDAKLAAFSGADAVLVGTALWRAADMGAMYQSLRVERSAKACVQL